jgi:hypothetical protein
MNYLIFIAALGYLNDTENSLKAYQQSIYHSTSSDDPVLYLNYSIALFNNADIEGAVKHYRMFQMKLRALPSDSVTDSEVQISHIISYSHNGRSQISVQSWQLYCK